MTRFIVIWHDERGAEIARDDFRVHGRAVVQAYALDQMRLHPKRCFRIVEEAALAPLAA
ncbi:hypothetical protein [Falsiroseomonas selenitidurans]|uniref:Uncharacterized protein n=1 Tax=Falsiroseomonas selenitidurans TaxID=2716335 RepID=A0ABX1EEZ4_9PROT|nr:hypothetical protein [Falsiroseomonas selenitidurans]NKC33475.1 hypothetical protein [Falsiroseomonas selenitidurans]